MKALAHLIICIVLLTSCAEQCNIAGNSTISSLDGRMLYLRVSADGGNTDCIDSCEVVHGRFSFFRDIDSIMMAQIYMGEESVMPIMLEHGHISIEVNHFGQKATGGPLNDRLYRFVQKKNRLENRQWELDQQCMRMMHEGKHPDEISRSIKPKALKLAHEVEKLETKFIMDNYENPLGPSYFMFLFGQGPRPILTEQVNQILNSAPLKFLQHPFVHNYVRRARINSNKSVLYDSFEQEDEY